MKKILTFILVTVMSTSLFSQNINRGENKTDINRNESRGRDFRNVKPTSIEKDSIISIDTTNLDTTKKTVSYVIKDEYKEDKYVLDKKLGNLSLNLIKANEYYQTGMIIQLSSFVLGTILTSSGVSNNNVGLRNFGYGVYGVGGIVSFGYIISAWNIIGKAGKDLR